MNFPIKRISASFLILAGFAISSSMTSKAVSHSASSPTSGSRPAPSDPSEVTPPDSEPGTGTGFDEDHGYDPMLEGDDDDSQIA